MQAQKVEPVHSNKRIETDKIALHNLQLSKGADINLCKTSLLYMACLQGYENIVELLRINTNINFCTRFRVSPLM